MTLTLNLPDPPLSPLGLAALTYAQEHGWAVFPLLPRSKRPRHVGGFHTASTSAEQIATWWTERPYDNIGVATGAVSGLLVIDVDAPEAEIALAAFGALPPTPISITGKGRHFLFQHPGAAFRTTVSKLANKIDTRGDGGYIVAAPSVHPDTGTMYL